MLQGIAGAFALLAEGAIFFCLQEPETVVRMGKIGKYLTELLRGWAILMSTASVILLFVPLLFPTKIAPAWCIWLGAAFCFLAANFIVLNRENERVEQAETRIGELIARKVRIIGVVLPPQKNEYTPTVSGLEYRIDVANASEALSVRNVEVKLERITPDIPELRLPVWLQQMHDNAPAKQTKFDLNPFAHKYIDLVLNRSDDTGMIVCHTVQGIQNRIPRGDYILTVSVTAEDASGDTKEFRVWNTDGTLHCEICIR